MRGAFILLFSMLIPALCFADTIELKNGKVIEGKIVDESADWLKVDTGVGIATLYLKDEIKDYRKGGSGEKEIEIPTVFTMEQLTPEQRKYVEENYVTSGGMRLDLSSGTPEITPIPPDAAELTDAAMKFFKQGRITEALAKAQEAIDRDKEYPPAYRVKADILQETGSAEQSIPLYDKVLEKDPTDYEAYMNRGYAYGRLNQSNRAIEDYSKAIELNPRAVNAISARAAAYGKIGNMELAKKDYERLMEFDQGQASYGLGNIAAYNHSWGEALGYYDQTIKATPDFGPVYLMKGQVLMQMGKKDEAIEALNKAKSLGMVIPPDLEKEM